MRATALLPAAVVLFSFLIAGCSESAPSASPAADSSAAQASPAAAPAAPAAAAPPKSEQRGRPVPAFDGTDLDGKPLSIQALLGRRILLFGFNPELPNARTVGAAVAAVAKERATNNFQIVGVSMGSTLETTRAFLKDARIDSPAFFDPNGELIQRLGLRANLWVLVVDADGNVIQGSDYFPTDGPEPAQTIEHMLRDYLRLPHAADATATELSGHPPAPDFSAPRLGGGDAFQLASLRGRPALLMFFLHTCPLCHEALKFLEAELDKLDPKLRPPLIGISVSNSEYAVKDQLERDGLDFFQVVFDPDVSIRNKYGALQGVPVLLLIDAQGRIVSRTNGWREDRDPPLTRMRLAQLLGREPPMLLSQSGYSGNEFCVVCHAAEAETWELTNHATALSTLVKQGADGRSECVTCHVVGYGQPGGYSIARPERSLENVGCETCHGRGGPHLSPSHLGPDGSYEKACATCHTPEHSLGFSYASFLPKVSHAANVQFAGLSAGEKAKLLAERRKSRGDLLPTAAARVGSDACASCHAAEFAKWKAHPHAQAAVGCESCHGPGGDHAAPEAAKKGTIVSLADKCGSCAILQVCGTCHDDAREPEFQFHIKQKIEHQRHSDRPLQGLVSRELPEATVAAVLDGAFAATGGR